MKSLLLTGATGFVGRNIVLREVARGTEIFAPVRSPEKLRAQLAAEGLAPDCVTPLPTDPARWGNINPTHAIHAAGVLFARDRATYFETNRDWTLRVLHALPPGCRTVVLSSQSAGGPTPHGLTARREADADTPITWYGESKLAMEREIASAFTERAPIILRPPTIIGPRDVAILPLLKMARGPVRIKPGIQEKWFSFLGISDVLDAIEVAAEITAPGPFYIACRTPFSDRELILAAAHAADRSGVTIPVPLCIMRGLAALVDAIPSLRDEAPSLTRDRVREIWPDLWVVDSTRFSELTGWRAKMTLDDAMRETWTYAAKNHFSRT